jgi:hypothetical protein
MTCKILQRSGSRNATRGYALFLKKKVASTGASRGTACDSGGPRPTACASLLPRQSSPSCLAALIPPALSACVPRVRAPSSKTEARTHTGRSQFGNLFVQTAPNPEKSKMYLDTTLVCRHVGRCSEHLIDCQCQWSSCVGTAAYHAVHTAGGYLTSDNCPDFRLGRCQVFRADLGC